MPRYITGEANFTPFTYDELVKPIDNMTNAQIEEQAAIDALAMESGAIGSMIGDDAPESRRMYDDYMASLKDLSDSLYNNGFSINTARGLSLARKNYGDKIAKINAAITNKDNAVKDYIEKAGKDDTLISEKDPRTISLDKWLNDSYAGYGKSYSGKTLITHAASVGENMRRGITENIEEWIPILGKQYWQNNMFTGFSVDDVNEAIDREMKGIEPEKNNIGLLQNAIRTVYQSSGMEDWADGENKLRALGYIGEGIYSAVGEHKISRLEDRNFTSDYQWATYQLSKDKLNWDKFIDSVRYGGGKNGSGNTTKSVFTPGIASQRGDIITGPKDKYRKTFNRITNVIDLLNSYNSLKKHNMVYGSDGNPTKEALSIVKDLMSIKEFRNMNVDIKSDDIDNIIETLSKQRDEMATSRSQYVFSLDNNSASNISKNLFAANIGELSGNKSQSVAKYEDGKSVKSNDLSSMLACKSLSIGYDFDSQKIVLYDKGDENGKKINDKSMYLDPSVLSNSYGTVYMDDIYYLNNAKIDIGDSNGATVDYSKIAASTYGSTSTFPLTEIARMLAVSKNEMMSAINILDDDKSSEEDIKRANAFITHYNSLVESLGMGLYDSSNINYKPSPYGYSWGKEEDGGSYSEEDIYNMLYGG